MAVVHPVVIILRLGCWVEALACDSERFGCGGKSPTNSTRNLISLNLKKFHTYSISKC